MRSTFHVVPKSDTLSLQIVFEHGRDKRIENIPPIRFAVPTDIVVECGTSKTGYGSCTRDLPADTALQLRVRSMSGTSLADVRVNGTVIALGTASIAKVAPTAIIMGIDGKPIVQRGDYAVTVEVPHTVRREIVLRVR